MHAYEKEQALLVAGFNRAASGYDRHADLQRTVAQRLLERLEFMRVSPRVVLDLGSGTGQAGRALSRRYPGAVVVELDIAADMLRAARPRWLRGLSRRAWLCADAQRLPLREASVDMVFSSLMLQWCNDRDSVLAEACRVLRPGGLLMFSTLGPDTLLELRQSWAAVDGLVHVNAFDDMHDIGDALVGAGLADPVMEVERITLTYLDGYALMRDLKRLGAHNVNQGRRRTLTGQGRMRRMLRAYESLRREGRLPATYEVVYGHGWRTQHALRIDPHTATFPVSALSRSARRAGPDAG